MVAEASTSSGGTGFFGLIDQAGRNGARAAVLLHEMIDRWPDEREGIARQIFAAEHEGDRITQQVIRLLNTTSQPPFDREDVYRLATTLDDVVDYIEEAADLFGLYQIEAPMQQALEMADALTRSCEHLAKALAQLEGFEGLERHWIEIHRLENEADRISRDAVASLFADGIDPMVVIRWKDIFAILERAVDSTEAAAHIIEGLAIKHASREAARPWWRRLT